MLKLRDTPADRLYVSAGRGVIPVVRAANISIAAVVEYFVFSCDRLEAMTKYVRRRSIKRKRPTVKGVKLNRFSVKPSILASVKVDYWTIAFGQGVKKCRILKSLAYDSSSQ